MNLHIVQNSQLATLPEANDFNGSELVWFCQKTTAELRRSFQYFRDFPKEMFSELKVDFHIAKIIYI